jgi:hypothetical protein
VRPGLWWLNHESSTERDRLMPELPSGFVELTGADLAAAEDGWNHFFEVFARPPESAKPRHAPDLHRIVYRDEFEPNHAIALRAAAQSLGESSCIVATDTMNGFAAVRADWPDYVKYAADESAATEVFEQVVPDHLFCFSDSRKWAFADIHMLDEGEMVGSIDFMSAYRSAFPDVIYDVLRWMHGDGSHLFEESKRVPAANGWRKVFGGSTELVWNPDRYIRPYLEVLYSSHDVDWLISLYEESRSWAGIPQGTFEAFEPFSDRLIAAVRERDGYEDRLVQIWSESRPN